MDRATLTLQQADNSTLSYIETLLVRNDLPAQDVQENPDWFYVAHSNTEPVGIGGVERYGTNGLLRSVVIARTARENGFGTALCEALEATASADGVETLYLLTTTAADFFANYGYRECKRTDAPMAIQQTTEFDSLSLLPSGHRFGTVHRLLLARAVSNSCHRCTPLRNRHRAPA